MCLEGDREDEGGAAQEAQRVAGNAGDRARDVGHTAQDEASHVADTAKQAGSDVVDTARQEAGHVVDEAKAQGKHLFDESVNELRTQAGQGQHRIAGVVRSLSDELESMSGNATERGVMVDLVDQVQRYGRDAADFLDNNSPDDVLESVRRYAARNPWTFMAISAGVGFLAARLVRGLNRDDSDDFGDARGRGHQRYAQTGYAQTGYGQGGYGRSAVPGGAVPATGAHDPLGPSDPYRTRPPEAVEDEVRGEYGGVVGGDRDRGEFR